MTDPTKRQHKTRWSIAGPRQHLDYYLHSGAIYPARDGVSVGQSWPTQASVRSTTAFNHRDPDLGDIPISRNPVIPLLVHRPERFQAGLAAEGTAKG